MHDEGIAVLLLDVAGHILGVEAGQIETLRRKETLWPAREGPPALLGFIDLGTPVPVMDLGICLGVGPSGLGARGLLVVPPINVALLAFRVEHVEGPYALTWKELASLPALLQEAQARQTYWAFAWRGEQLIPLLDLGQVVAPEEMGAILDLMI